MSKVAAPSETRLAEIAELAEGIADELFPDSAIDPEFIIRQKGITLSRGAYGDSFDGMLEHRSGRFHIYCNVARAQNSARVRFTLAHEFRSRCLEVSPFVDLQWPHDCELRYPVHGVTESNEEVFTVIAALEFHR